MWPSVRLEDRQLQATALELRRRLERFQALASELTAERNESIEEVSGQGGIPHEWLDLSFTVRDNAGTLVKMGLSDSNDLWLFIRRNPPWLSEIELSGAHRADFARLVEETLRLMLINAPRGAVEKLWRE